MPPDITGIHHVTALCGSAAENLHFYSDTLGLRLVKKTVNFDDPRAYHFYYGDQTGRPGTLVTFFPHPSFRVGVAGASEVGITHLAVPQSSLGHWADRLKKAGVETVREGASPRERLRFRDPAGTRLTLSEADRGATSEHGIIGLAAASIVVNKLKPTALFLTETLGFRQIADASGRAWFEPGSGNSGQSIEVIEQPTAPRPVLGVGSVHHVAWRVADDAAQARVRALVEGKVTGMTDVRDRQYFRSIYFREPGGVIFEIATDGPGFLIDEAEATLGSALKLPPQFESRRAEIEAALPSLEI